jgi:hypothetical protein
MLPTHGEVSLFGGRKASVPAKSEEQKPSLKCYGNIPNSFLFFLTLILLLEFITLSSLSIRFYGQAAQLTRDNARIQSTANAATARRGNTTNVWRSRLGVQTTCR